MGTDGNKKIASPKTPRRSSGASSRASLQRDSPRGAILSVSSGDDPRPRDTSPRRARGSPTEHLQSVPASSSKTNPIKTPASAQNQQKSSSRGPATTPSSAQMRKSILSSVSSAPRVKTPMEISDRQLRLVQALARKSGAGRDTTTSSSSRAVREESSESIEKHSAKTSPPSKMANLVEDDMENIELPSSSRVANAASAPVGEMTNVPEQETTTRSTLESIVVEMSSSEEEQLLLQHGTNKENNLNAPTSTAEFELTDLEIEQNESAFDSVAVSIRENLEELRKMKRASKQRLWRDEQASLCRPKDLQLVAGAETTPPHETSKKSRSNSRTISPTSRQTPDVQSSNELPTSLQAAAKSFATAAPFDTESIIKSGKQAIQELRVSNEDAERRGKALEQFRLAQGMNNAALVTRLNASVIDVHRIHKELDTIEQDLDTDFAKMDNTITRFFDGRKKHLKEMSRTSAGNRYRNEQLEKMREKSVILKYRSYVNNKSAETAGEAGAPETPEWLEKWQKGAEALLGAEYLQEIENLGEEYFFESEDEISSSTILNASELASSVELDMSFKDMNVD